MKDRPEFMEFLQGQGVTFEDGTVDPTTLKPSQREFSLFKSEIAKGVPAARACSSPPMNDVPDGHPEGVGQMDLPKIRAVKCG